MTETLCYFQIVKDPNAENLCTAGSGEEAVFFCRANISEEQREEIEKELQNWEIIDTYKWKYEDLAYDHEESGEGEKAIPFDHLVFSGSYASNDLRGGILLENGKFAGIAVKLENTSSYGMSSSRDEGYGVLFTDGTKTGRTDYHYFHCSTEISESNDDSYSLRRKQ